MFKKVNNWIFDNFKQKIVNFNIEEENDPKLVDSELYLELKE